MRLPCAGGAAMLLELLFAPMILARYVTEDANTGTLQASATQEGTKFNAKVADTRALQASATQRGTKFNASHVLRGDQLVYGDRKLVPDHAWAEVMRFSSNCGSSTEGLSTGFEADCGPGYVQLGRPELASCDAAKPPSRVGYGCWFFFSDGPLISQHYYEQRFGFKVNKSLGSGIGINVGRSLRVDTRGEASNALGLPCVDAPLCEKPNTVQDKLYCERAVELGYDSIQFARPHRTCMDPSCESTNPQELLLCTGSCMTQRVESACPSGVEVRALGERSYDPCECDNESDVLNCGMESYLYGRPNHGSQVCPKNMDSEKLHVHLRAPELYELLTFLKPAEMVSHIINQQHRARMRLLLKAS